MTTMAARAAGIVACAIAAGACTTLGDIQRQTPVRTTKFSADPQAVARCAQQRIGGKMELDGFGRWVVYDAVKTRQSEGITHYSVSFRPAEGKGGTAELRILRPLRGAGPSTTPPPRASSELIAEYWNPVVECAKPPAREPA